MIYPYPNSSFFENHVQPVLDRSAKLYVVISDALRFESVSELKERVIREDRYTCELEGMLGMLPSYTQLGMAALLPHQTLELGEDANKVMVDGQSSQGLENRKKLLETELPGRATALHVKDFLKLRQVNNGIEVCSSIQDTRVLSTMLSDYFRLGDDLVEIYKRIENH